MNYKGICDVKSKRAGLDTECAFVRPSERVRTRAKKNPNERFGFNPPKEEVEETAEVANCRNRWSNYMKQACATQEHLQCEIAFHNADYE
ncbi:hypothetical protein ACW9YQ_31790 (plasmid) [Paraburkholderia strydomiana]